MIKGHRCALEQIALCIQIWTALVALLLLKYLHHLSRFGWTLSNLATMLPLNLFTYRDLMTWLIPSAKRPCHR
jgi:hypothetical protein